METKINTISKEFEILSLFFENQEKGFGIREISRKLKINHTSVRQYLNKLVKDEYLIIKTESLYPLYHSNINKAYLNLKLFYNLEKLRESELVEFLEKEYDYPAIIVFGSYAQAQDRENSDLDLFIISSIKKEPSLEIYEKKLKRKISLHVFNKKEVQNFKDKNSQFLNNLIKGIVLAGEPELI